jgi:hypothetical protein
MNVRTSMTAMLSLFALAAGPLLVAPAALAATPPLVEETSVVNVAGTSATFRARIDPDESETTYRFEYGTSEAYGSSIPVPDGLVGSGATPVTVTAHPQDLAPSTTYHYRVLALVPSRGETIAGGDGTFTTQSAAGEFALPDGRQWELVSPPNKHGALIQPLTSSHEDGHVALQAAEAGDAITYATNVPTDIEPQGYVVQEQAFSKRGAQGWTTHDIGMPHSSSTGLVEGSEGYELFSADLSEAFTEPGQLADLLSPQASEQTLYIRREKLCNSPATAGECFLPLVTGEEGVADVPPGTKFGQQHGTLTLAAATPDLRHVAFGSEVALTEAAIPQGVFFELYEWSAATPAREALQPISTLPASEGGGLSPVLPTVGARGFKGNDSGGRHAISNDGTRVFWGIQAGGENPQNALYMRDMSKRETVRLDVVQPGAPGGSEPEPVFQIASSDGSKVFFTDRGQRLTTGSGQKGRDLYECEMVQEAGKWTCRLTDLTSESAGQPAEAQKMVLGASEDGSYVYFVANGVLGDAAEHGAVGGACDEHRTTALCNLYEYHDGKVTFIATLANEDETDWGGNEFGELGSLTARVSPDGRYLAFMSEMPLTGYDNRDTVTGRPDQEVYLYDAASGHLACVSCNPTGGRPVGIEVGEFFSPIASSSNPRPNVADVIESTQEQSRLETGIAANLPGGVVIGSNHEALYQPRLLFDSGRLFFNSADALVPQDINGQEDLYEYEPPGVGSCSASSVTFDPKVDGCVTLISSGTSSEEAGFVDASADGGDVFFLTESRLTSQDYDAAYDLYDAHECTPAAPCSPEPVAPPPCTSGDSCKGAPSPQPALYGAPASATFSGAGNLAAPPPKPAVVRKAKRPRGLARALRACRERHRRRSRCERQARRRYAGAARMTKRETRKAEGR